MGILPRAAPGVAFGLLFLSDQEADADDNPVIPKVLEAIVLRQFQEYFDKQYMPRYSYFRGCKEAIRLYNPTV